MLIQCSDGQKAWARSQSCSSSKANQAAYQPAMWLVGTCLADQHAKCPGHAHTFIHQHSKCTHSFMHTFIRANTFIHAHTSIYEHTLIHALTLFHSHTFILAHTHSFICTHSCISIVSAHIHSCTQYVLTFIHAHTLMRTHSRMRTHSFMRTIKCTSSHCRICVASGHVSCAPNG